MTWRGREKDDAGDVDDGERTTRAVAVKHIVWLLHARGGDVRFVGTSDFATNSIHVAHIAQ